MEKLEKLLPHERNHKIIAKDESTNKRVAAEILTQRLKPQEVFVGSMDAGALYPSLDVNKSSQMVAKFVRDSGLKLKEKVRMSSPAFAYIKDKLRCKPLPHVSFTTTGLNDNIYDVTQY